jgi:hypothetical protein
LKQSDKLQFVVRDDKLKLSDTKLIHDLKRHKC